MTPAPRQPWPQRCQRGCACRNGRQCTDSPMPIWSAAALMAPPLAGAAIAPDEPANNVAPAIRRAEHTILMTFLLRRPADPDALLLNGGVRLLVPRCSAN